MAFANKITIAHPNAAYRIQPLILKITAYFMLTLLVPAASGARGAWTLNRAEAFTSARAQGKMVFLLGGRPSCNNCTYIRETVVNATNPPLNQMMEECFVAWYCNCDANTNEQEPYEAGLGGYSLPLMCWIDPDIRLGAYLDRRTGPLDDPVMLLLMRKAIRKVAPKAQNSIDRQIVVDPSFAVHGRLFTNLLATQVFYQINDAPWAEALTQGPSACKTNWSVSLAAHTLRLGADANRLRIYAVYADRSRSPTNTLTFTHAPPPLQITQHPTPVLTLVGHEASFSVLASNATSFTGYHHGSNAAVGIGSTLRLPRAHLSDGGLLLRIEQQRGRATQHRRSLGSVRATHHPRTSPGAPRPGAGRTACKLDGENQPTRPRLDPSHQPQTGIRLAGPDGPGLRREDIPLLQTPSALTPSPLSTKRALRLVQTSSCRGLSIARCKNLTNLAPSTSWPEPMNSSYLLTAPAAPAVCRGCRQNRRC